MSNLPKGHRANKEPTDGQESGAGVAPPLFFFLRQGLYIAVAVLEFTGKTRHRGTLFLPTLLIPENLVSSLRSAVKRRAKEESGRVHNRQSAFSLGNHSCWVCCLWGLWQSCSACRSSERSGLLVKGQA